MNGPAAGIGEVEAEWPRGLTRALAAWRDRGDPGPALRWLDQELGPERFPRRLPIPLLWACLEAFDRARTARSQGWPVELDARLEPVFQLAMRFSVPNGASVFGPLAARRGRGELIGRWGDRLQGPGLKAVARRWFPARGKSVAPTFGPLPLPAFASDPRPIAVLRPDWNRQGDLLAVDHRQPREPCYLHLIGSGRTLLAPTWEFSSPVSISPPRVTTWFTGPLADVFEWTFRVPALRVTVLRSVVLLRGRRLALVAELWEGGSPPLGLCLGLPTGCEMQPVTGSRALRATSSGKKIAEYIPVTLAAEGLSESDGRFDARGDRILLQTGPTGKRTWQAVLVSWGPERNRRGTSWRPLTVTEQTQVCPPGTAFASRVAWGRGESLVLYRSLGPPAPRTFLGHPTTARLLIGKFGADGKVTPLVTIA